jgi:hypothetical protein
MDADRLVSRHMRYKKLISTLLNCMFSSLCFQVPKWVGHVHT